MRTEKVSELPQDLRLAFEEVELCAMGVSDPPDNKTLGRLLTRLLPMKEYFVWAHKFSPIGEHTLIVSRNELWVSGACISEQEPIFDSRQQGSDKTQLCQWIISELEYIYAQETY